MTDFDIWTIYCHPSDYPNSFVARRHTIKLGATDDILIATTLEEARDLVQTCSVNILTMIPRADADHPDIVESWI